MEDIYPDTSRDSCFSEDSCLSNPASTTDQSTTDQAEERFAIEEERRRMAEKNSKGLKEEYEEEFVITEEMEEEEEKMAAENEKEEKKLKEEYEKELKDDEDLETEVKRKRLMHLLNQSQFYTNFLLKKIEDTKLREAKRREELKVAKEKKAAVESQSLTEINNPSVSSPKRAAVKNSRKRALITDYIDEKTIQDVKKRRADEISENPVETSEATKGFHINSMGLEVPDCQPYLLEGGVLREYQLQGLEWMKTLFENGVNGILADEMGLGKTVQVISLICHLVEKGISGPFLIVAPLSTLPNWLMEFERFAPQIPVVLFHGYKNTLPLLYKKIRTKVKINDKITVAPVVLTTYQVPLKEYKFMSALSWRYIIVDEGHILKNSNTLLSRCLKGFKTVNRLLLTGTPLQNNLKELWSLLNFLLPDVFDDLSMFQSLFDIEAVTSSETSDTILKKESESQILSTLHKILTPFLLRRLKSDVELNLPPKKEVIVYCPLTDFQIKLYKATIDKVIESVLKTKERAEVLHVNVNEKKKKRKCAEKRKDYSYKDYDWFGEKDVSTDEEQKVKVEKPSTHTTLHMANPEMQLRKIANHPYLVQLPVEEVDGHMIMTSSEDIVNASGKMLALNAMLLNLHLRGHKVLIFSFFKGMLNLIEEFAIIRNYNYVRLDGDDNIDRRKENIRLFNTDPEIFLFLITTRAGGLGLNLTAADTVIIIDSDYNPQVDLQAMDRCHRIGQKNTVMVYRLISKGTVDEKIQKMAVGKRKLEKVVIKKGLFKFGNPNKAVNDLEELKQLLESADHHKTVQANGLVFTDEELKELLDRSCESAENQGSHFKVVKEEAK